MDLHSSSNLGLTHCLTCLVEQPQPGTNPARSRTRLQFQSEALRPVAGWLQNDLGIAG